MFNYILLSSFYYITLVIIETVLNTENLDGVLCIILLPCYHVNEISGLVHLCRHSLQNHMEPLLPYLQVR